jgi:F-type H+-transporting ATPase subunit delta
MSPVITLEVKNNILKNIFLGSKLSVVVQNFLKVVVKNYRFDLLKYVIDNCERKLLISSGSLPVEVISSAPLSSLAIDKIVAFLEGKLGKKVLIDAKLDNNIRSGVIIKYDDMILDVSLLGLMEKLRILLKKAIV